VVAVADSVIWTARLRTGRVVTFRASVSKDFRGAALIAAAAAVDSAVIALGAVVDLAAVLDALVDSAVAVEDSGVDGKN
jgi:hypothetical protein